MINPRLLIQLPLIVLGSCVPLTPSTSIIVYASNGQPSEIRSFDPSKKADPKTGVVDSVVCKVPSEKEVAAYQLPKRPNFKDLPPEQDEEKAIVDRLIDNNEALRKELQALKDENLCIIRQLPKLQKTRG